MKIGDTIKLVKCNHPSPKDVGEYMTVIEIHRDLINVHYAEGHYDWLNTQFDEVEVVNELH